MKNRRDFFTQLASGLVTLSSAQLFIPKLIKPVWKVPPKIRINLENPYLITYIETREIFARIIIYKGEYI